MSTTTNDRAAWLKGGAAVCAAEPKTRPQFARRLILLGAPGVGKGTQAELLCEHLGTCHLSTGDVFRAAKCISEGERSPAIVTALDFMKQGKLVPDETVISMVFERVRCLRCFGGFLLDGYPRTVSQAESLEKALTVERINLDAVINYELPLDEIVSRLGGRRTCSGCKAVFHELFRKPKAAGVCDHCGAQLIQREDDRPESIRVRMKAYEDSTRPLIDFYKKRNLLLSVSADGTPAEICERTLKLLNNE